MPCGLRVRADRSNEQLTNDTLRLGVQEPVTPEHSAEVTLLDLELVRIEPGKLAQTERPAINGTGKQHVTALGRKVNVLVFALLVLVVCVVVGSVGGLSGRLALGTLRQALLARLAPTQVVLHTLRGVKRAHDGVDLLDQAGNVVVRF